VAASDEKNTCVFISLPTVRTFETLKGSGMINRIFSQGYGLEYTQKWWLLLKTFKFALEVFVMFLYKGK